MPAAAAQFTSNNSLAHPIPSHLIPAQCVSECTIRRVKDMIQKTCNVVVSTNPLIKDKHTSLATRDRDLFNNHVPLTFDLLTLFS